MSAVQNTAAKRSKVLVVDDDPNAAELVGALLELQGHEVFTAQTPVEALSLAARVGPEIAFLDIGLPKMSGFELADAIRRLPGMNACRFVAITGFDDSDDEHRGKVSGFEARLLKPIATENAGSGSGRTASETLSARAAISFAVCPPKVADPLRKVQATNYREMSRFEYAQ